MNPYVRRPLALLLGLLFSLSLAAAACAEPLTKADLASTGLKDPKKVVAFVAALRKAVTSADKAAVAAAVEYPIEIQAKESRSITTPAEFVQNYDAIMTKSVCSAILDTDPFVTPRGIIQMNQDDAQVWLSVDNGKLRIGSIISD